MAPSVDIGFAIGPRAISNRQIHQAQIELGRPEEQIEITEWIEITEIGAVPRDGLVVFAEKDFGATESVFDLLAEQPTEGHAKELVRNHVEKLHRLLLHRINQP